MAVKPVNCNVLVLPDEADGKIGSIVLPESIKERDQHAQTEGALVAMCDDAFQEMAEKPAIGSRVCFAKYAGSAVVVDGVSHRLMKDIDVTGLIV